MPAIACRKYVSIDHDLDRYLRNQLRPREARNDLLRRLLGLPPAVKAKRGRKPGISPWRKADRKQDGQASG